MTKIHRYSAVDLRDFARDVLEALGVPAAKADLVAESLVAANLRGVDSHGLHLLPAYVKQLECGNIDPLADGEVLSQSGACLLFDGKSGIGQCVSETCCGHAIRLGQRFGLGMVVARDSNHFGAAAFWAQRISDAGLIGIVMCNASPGVPPWQGKEGRLGTNPVCVSVPSSKPGGWLLDMATTTVAMNKITKAVANREPTIPEGWAMDAEGFPTTDTQKAHLGLLMPLGGYKGSGLAMMVEILCAVLSGGVQSSEVGGVHIVERPMATSQLFLAIEVERFLPLPEFQSRMEHLVRAVKSTRPAAGFQEVLVAGDPEWRAEASRLREGVPIDKTLRSRLIELGALFEVPFPEAR